MVVVGSNNRKDGFHFFLTNTFHRTESGRKIPAQCLGVVVVRLQFVVIFNLHIIMFVVVVVVYIIVSFAESFEKFSIYLHNFVFARSLLVFCHSLIKYENDAYDLQEQFSLRLKQMFSITELIIVIHFILHANSTFFLSPVLPYIIIKIIIFRIIIIIIFK